MKSDVVAAPVESRVGPDLWQVAPSVVMMVCVVLAYWLAGGFLVMAVLAGVLLIPSPWIPWRYRPSKRLSEWLYILIAIPFVLIALTDSNGDVNTMLSGNQFTQLSTMYLLCLAIQEIYRVPTQRTPVVTHGALLGVLFHAGITYEVTAYPIVVSVYSAAALLWFRQANSRSPSMSAPGLSMMLVGLVLAVVLAAGVAATLFGYLRREERVVMNAFQQSMFSRAGFLMGPMRESSLGSLGDMYLSSGVMLRWFGPNPEHLRAQVLATYEHNAWKRESQVGAPTHEASQPLLPGEMAGLTLTDPGRGTLYHFDGPLPAGSMGTASLVEDVATAIPVPRGAYAVRTSSGAVKADTMGVLRFMGLPSAVECDVAWFPGAREDFSGRTADPPVYVDVPDYLRDRVAGLAHEIVGAETDPHRQAELVQTWLLDHCTYVRNPPEVRGQDRLETFLFVNHQGYCEYFASAMALMLRSLKVPCRYVLGYMVREHNSVGDYWVVRGRDAHAWVEVYLPGRGWTTWDPTPPAELTALYATMPGWSSDLFDQYGLWFTRFWASVHSGNWKLLIKNGLGYIRTLVLLAGPALLWLAVPAVAGYLWWRRRHGPTGGRRRRARREAAADPVLVLLQGALRRMEVRMARSGRVREAHQTLVEFNEAGLDDSARELIRVYCEYRYGGRTPDASFLDRVQHRRDGC